jgi:DNA-binding winged helix-turn-helix (wHTH) protein
MVVLVPSPAPRRTVVAGEAELDPELGIRGINGRMVELTAIETTVAHALLVRAGGIVTQAELIDTLWPGDDLSACKNRLYTHVFGLRRKLQSVQARLAIHTSRCGYRLAL